MNFEVSQNLHFEITKVSYISFTPEQLSERILGSLSLICNKLFLENKSDVIIGNEHIDSIAVSLGLSSLKDKKELITNILDEFRKFLISGGKSEYMWGTISVEGNSIKAKVISNLKK